jgi:hypothetical protein
VAEGDTQTPRQETRERLPSDPIAAPRTPRHQARIQSDVGRQVLCMGSDRIWVRKCEAGKSERSSVWASTSVRIHSWVGSRSQLTVAHKHVLGRTTGDLFLANGTRHRQIGVSLPIDILLTIHSGRRGRPSEFVTLARLATVGSLRAAFERWYRICAIELGSAYRKRR